MKTGWLAALFGDRSHTFTYIGHQKSKYKAKYSLVVCFRCNLVQYHRYVCTLNISQMGCSAALAGWLVSRVFVDWLNGWFIALVTSVI